MNQYIGKVIEGYTVDEFLGSGHYGQVYKGHSSDGRVVAIKFIVIPTAEHIKDFETSYGSDPEMMENFFDDVANKFIAETESLKKLNQSNLPGSNNIVGYYSHTASKQGMNHEIIIIMEFGNKYSEYLSTNDVTYDLVTKVGIDIASGLEACHANNIIHRDIKDDNIFVDNNGNFKIGDFGAANMSASTRGRTQGIGTPYFMAPEVRTDTNYSYNADIYSLGIMMYRLLNNKRFPFVPTDRKLSVNDNETAFKRRLAGEQIPAPMNDMPELSRIVLRCCSFDPMQRYSSATELKNDLINLKQANMQNPIWNSALQYPKDPIKPKVQVQVNQDMYINQNQNNVQQRGTVTVGSVISPGTQQNGNRTVGFNGGNQQQGFSQQNINNRNGNQTVGIGGMGNQGYSQDIGNQSGGRTVGIGGLNGGQNNQQFGVQNGQQFGGRNGESTMGLAGGMNNNFGGTSQQHDDLNNILGGGNNNSGMQDGMKTNDIISKMIETLGANNPAVSKIIEKTKAVEQKNNEIKKISKRSTKFKIGSIAGIIGIVVIIAVVAIFIWPQTYKYGKNENDGGFLYLYQFGKPVRRVPEDGDAYPVDYVTWDSKHVYFSMHDKGYDDPEDHKMYRISRDDEELELVTNDHCEYDILVDDWVYYISTNENYQLCRLNKNDFDNKEVLWEEPIQELQMKDNENVIKCIKYDGDIFYLDVRNEEPLFSDENPLE